MSEGIGSSGYATLTRPTTLMVQAGLDNKAATTATLLPKPTQPRGEPVGPKQIRPVV